MVRILNTKNYEPIFEMKGHAWGVNKVAFSPDNNLLASCSTDKTVILWDVKTGKNLGYFNAGIGSVNTVVFTKDGKKLIVGGTEPIIKVWEFSENKG